jgi:hypothetical protein
VEEDVAKPAVTLRLFEVEGARQVVHVAHLCLRGKRGGGRLRYINIRVLQTREAREEGGVM